MVGSDTTLNIVLNVKTKLQLVYSIINMVYFEILINSKFVFGLSNDHNFQVVWIN